VFDDLNDRTLAERTSAPQATAAARSTPEGGIDDYLAGRTTGPLLSPGPGDDWINPRPGAWYDAMHDVHLLMAPAKYDRTRCASRSSPVRSAGVNTAIEAPAARWPPRLLADDRH
jgi:hypothetical protein